MADRLADLSKAGVSIWLDDLSRERLTSGSLASLVARDHVVGVTTNPTIFAKAISGGGEAYAGQLHDLWARGTCVHEALRDMTTHDVRWACDVLRPAYDATDGVDGRASIEVDPRLAYDTEATIAEARALWWRVDRPNLFIKIPAARQGLPAIAACLAEGISINVTLIFSLTRYDEVMDAFLEGLERARQAGHDLAQIASVASFFVSRVDTEVDARLDKIGTAAAAALRGWAAIANARLAYQHYEEMLASPPPLIALAKMVGLVVTPTTWSRATRLARLPLVSRSRLRSSSQIETPALLRSASRSAMIVILSGGTLRGAPSLSAARRPGRRTRPGWPGRPAACPAGPT